ADSYSNYQNAVEFLYRNLRLSYEIKGFGPRKEILEVPEDALKEALVNALAHRDYLEKGANVLVEIYDNRVEITNPGGLVSAIKKDKFGKKSFSRNPLLFSLFKRVNLVEKVGSGIGRMRRAMKEAGLPLPKFEFTNFFTVTFTRAVKTVGKTTLKTGESILILVRKNPKITKEELAKQLGITIDGVKYHIKQLRKKGVIEWKGPTKSGHWEVIGK
ncbi:winged helix-turn-helix transcriptional regulator, partial [Candidatus Woesearchaeota archaeon]|nr:winged helix-turn-helix transcriptional regulator [Candidatus Woesearchaeota archaeon]